MLKCNVKLKLIMICAAMTPSMARPRCASCKCKGNDENNNGIQLITNNDILHTEHNETPDEKTTSKPRSRCCPYDFDRSFCRVVGDRVVCGYNRNIGKPQGEDGYREMSDGCRLHGGRLECGYWKPPYMNSRRPQANPVKKVIEASSMSEDCGENHRATLRRIILTTRATQAPVPTQQSDIKCVEIQGRVVCRDR